MILLQPQPFGWRDPWAVVHHTAAASTLRAVCTVLHQLIQLSLSGARPRVNFSRSSRSEAAHLRGMTPGRWADAADHVTDIEKPHLMCTTRSERQTSMHHKDPTTFRDRGRSYVCGAEQLCGHMCACRSGKGDRQALRELSLSIPTNS